MAAESYTHLGAFEEGCQKLISSHPNLTQSLIKVLQWQEEVLLFPSVDNEMLLKLGMALIETVKALPLGDFKPVVIDIEVNNRCVFHYAMPHTSPDNEWWIERKKRTTKHFEAASYLIGRSLAYNNKTWEQKYEGLPTGEYAAHGGCFPIRVKGGMMVGTITMSGLAQVLDHVTIARVLKKVLFD